MVVDVTTQKFIFGFAPNCYGSFVTDSTDTGDDEYLQGLGIKH